MFAEKIAKVKGGDTEAFRRTGIFVKVNRKYCLSAALRSGPREDFQRQQIFERQFVFPMIIHL